MHSEISQTLHITHSSSKFVHSIPAASIDSKTPFFNLETQSAIPPLPNHQTLIHTHPTSLAVSLNIPQTVLHHQNVPEFIPIQSAASKRKEMNSELLNDFRCILSYISMSNSCNLCFALSMIG